MLDTILNIIMTSVIGIIQYITKKIFMYVMKDLPINSINSFINKIIIDVIMDMTTTQ